MTTLALRAPTPTDVPFIKSTWLKSYRFGRAVRGVPNSVYFPMHDQVIQVLLTRGEVVLCVDQDNPQDIAGWMCYEQAPEAPELLILHYIYVKAHGPLAGRRMGVAKRMLQATLALLPRVTVVAYTHDTEYVFQCLNERGHERQYLGLQWVYDPYAVWRMMPANWAGL